MPTYRELVGSWCAAMLALLLFWGVQAGLRKPVLRLDPFLGSITIKAPGETSVLGSVTRRYGI